MSIRRHCIAALAAATALSILSCQKGETGSTSTGSAATPARTGNTVAIQGAGATFPYPIYEKWFEDYGVAHPEIHFVYQPVGSGGGIKQFTEQMVFFGASDGPMTDEQIKAAPFPVMHFPTVLGGVVPVYNIPGVKAQLKFPAAALAGIFLGRLTRWNAPELVRANPGVPLPNSDITTIHRSDGSGTNYIFCDFLSKVSAEFRKKVGVGTTAPWPGGVGARGNKGVSSMVQVTPGSIGYVELIYALQTKIAYGSVQNAAGEYVTASPESVTAAAAAAAQNMPADFRVSITNAQGKGVYPISSFTWMLLQQRPADKQRAKLMVDFMKWALTEGQKDATALGYAPLPKAVVDLEMQALQKIEL